MRSPDNETTMTTDQITYADLPECCKQRIREKCQWEHMSVTGVMRDWPDLRCDEHTVTTHV